MKMEAVMHKYANSTRPVFYKSFSALELKADMSTRKVSGYLASFGTVDLDGDLIVRGAFAKSIAERGPNSRTARKIAFLWQHDMKEPIGRFTLLEEDEKGLYFEAIIDEIPLGDRVLTQYASGTLDQHSIGFRYVWDKSEWNDELGAFILKEVNLFEGSVVTIGMNENTPFTGMKGVQKEVESTILDRETEKFLKSLPPELEYQGRQIIAKHVAFAEIEPRPALKIEPVTVTTPEKKSINYKYIYENL